ncbi:tripartite tricarboxylate transporter TctB family protein [Oscillibacter sp.]|uniref:tripartite tricarboxylate transporter TctB family protein n=1 Tax=Oscillibacter sp. TaxID=1945593 RepID=UPI0028AEB1F0|nr:tripartite tricarboxylate transporter TctB family protein [Oscillibacter sp.]
MKKVIRNTNDLLLAAVMGALSVFLLTSKHIITGVENGLGGIWAQASTYIHLLAGILLGLCILQLIYAINFKRDGEHQAIKIPISKEIVITAVALVLYALLLPVLTFFPCTLVLIIVLCGTFAMKENQGDSEKAGKLPKKQLVAIVVYSVILTVALWVLFTQLLKCILP